MKIKREKLSASPSRKVRGRRLPEKEQTPDLDLQKLREELQACPGGF
jgi:hypothetical protein